MFQHSLERLTENADNLPGYIQSEIARMTDEWKTSHLASQVVWVILRSATIAAALYPACRNYAGHEASFARP